MPVRVYAPLGMLGYGFPASSLRRALALAPDGIAVDGGSIDPGPYYLGTGESFTSEVMVRRDLRLLLPAALELGVPLLIGSAGGAGAAPHLARTVAVLRDLAGELGLSFRLATIPSDIPPTVVKAAIEAGQVDDFEAGRPLRPEDVDACEHVVGQMGVEPFLSALEQGAQVVVAGRSYDAAMTAALGIWRGADPALAYHLGKIIECGSMVATPRTSDGVVGTIGESAFEVEPADPRKRCTVGLVAAHTLYEKSDPYTHHFPGGRLDLTACRYRQEDERRVSVAGSRYVKAERYTVKLEGSSLVGYRALCVAGLRDPRLIADIDAVQRRVVDKVGQDLQDVVGRQEYSVRFLRYGSDGVMGEREPHKGPRAHELGLVIEVVGKTQQTADAVAALVRSATLHADYEGRIATAGNLAFPFSPAEFAGPPVYAFRIYHLLGVDEPEGLFPVGLETVE